MLELSQNVGLLVICETKQEGNETRTKRNKNETKQRTKRNKNETKQEQNKTRTKRNKRFGWGGGKGWGGELPQISHLQHPNYSVPRSGV